MNVLRSIPRNRSANRDLADAVAAASLIGELNLADLDEVTDEVMKAVETSQQVSIENLQLERPIGLGGQGGVWLARDSRSRVPCAVKQVRKGRLAALPKKSAMRVFTEKDALVECKHPFITRLHGTFQDASSLYFCLELMSAGDLFGLLDMYPTGLQEVHARFYSATISLALRHIHSRGYVYRDVKLENVLIGSDGYVKLCDFGYAKCVASTRTYTKCGTDEYAPPEAVSGRGRSTAADWWGLGILLHEMLTGRPPFEGRSSEDIFAQIEKFTKGGSRAAAQLQTRLSQTAASLTEAAGDFLVGLLRVDESQRIGCGAEGFISVQRHPWFTDLDWAALLKKQITPPWMPPATPNDGAVECDAVFEEAAVMNDKPFDESTWGVLFDEFGPKLSTPSYATPAVGSTPTTHAATSH